MKFSEGQTVKKIIGGNKFTKGDSVEYRGGRFTVDGFVQFKDTPNYLPRAWSPIGGMSGTFIYYNGLKWTSEKTLFLRMVEIKIGKLPSEATL